MDAVKKGTSAMGVNDTPVAAVLIYRRLNPTTQRAKWIPLTSVPGRDACKSALLKPKKRASEPAGKNRYGQLKLLPSLTRGAANYAMVEESSGKGYVIKPGTYIGGTR